MASWCRCVNAVTNQKGSNPISVSLSQFDPMVFLPEFYSDVFIYFFPTAGTTERGVTGSRCAIFTANYAWIHLAWVVAALTLMFFFAKMPRLRSPIKLLSLWTLTRSSIIIFLSTFCTPDSEALAALCKVNVTPFSNVDLWPVWRAQVAILEF